MQQLRYWLKGVRFYIAAGSLLVTLLVTWWSYTAYAGTPLFGSRLEEVFAWLATTLLAMAIAIGPSYKLFPRLPGRHIMFDARRLIGVSAGWFAALHISIAYASQFKLANPLSLPGAYQQSFLVGLVAFVVLFAMVATSFNAAFDKLGIWWFRLHRLVYVAALCILLHAFLTGVHATQPVVLIILSFIAALFVVAYCVIFARQKQGVTILQLVTLTGVTLGLIVILGFGFHQHARQLELTTYGVQS